VTATTTIASHHRPRRRSGPTRCSSSSAWRSSWSSLDVAIVNVALPSIHADLGFSTTGLQWVINAYTLTFAGFLLMLGGRAADTARPPPRAARRHLPRSR